MDERRRPCSRLHRLLQSVGGGSKPVFNLQGGPPPFKAREEEISRMYRGRRRKGLVTSTFTCVRQGRGAGFLHFPLLPCQKFLNFPPMDKAGKSCGLLLHVTEAGAHVQPPLVYAAPASLKKRTNHYYV